MILNFAELLFGVPRKLAHTYRYATTPTLYKETVDAHTFHAMYYAFTIAYVVEATTPVTIDWKVLAMSGCNHDLDEGDNGDLLRHVKRKSPELHKLWNVACKMSISDYSTRLIGRDDLVDYWVHDKDESTIEGRIFMLADFLCVYAFVKEEMTRGNHHNMMIECYENCCGYIYDNFSEVLHNHNDPLYNIVYLLFTYLSDVELLEKFKLK